MSHKHGRFVLELAVALLIVPCLFLFKAFREWFATDPIDVMFSFGNIAFGTSGLKGIANIRTRVDRWSSGPTAIVLTAYLVAYLHIGANVTLVLALVGVFNWWFLFFRRYIGKPIPNTDNEVNP